MYVCYVSGVCQCVFYAVGKSLPVCFSVVGVVRLCCINLDFSLGVVRYFDGIVI